MDNMQPQETRRIVNVRITNNNTKTFSDVYDGRHYAFAGGGKTTSIPLDAAEHIFGYRVKGADEQSMFDHVCKRWGWNKPENVANEFESVKGIWANFMFTPVAVKMVEQPVIDTGSIADARSEEEIQQEASPIPDLKLGQPGLKAGKTAA